MILRTPKRGALAHPDTVSRQQYSRRGSWMKMHPHLKSLQLSSTHKADHLVNNVYCIPREGSHALDFGVPVLVA